MARATFEKLMRLSSAAEAAERAEAERVRQERAEAETRRREARKRRRSEWRERLSLAPLEVGTRLWRKVDITSEGTKKILGYPQDVHLRRTDRGSLMLRAARGPELDRWREDWVCQSWVAEGADVHGPVVFIEGDLPEHWTYLAVAHIARKTVGNRGNRVRLTVFAHAVVGSREELLAQYGYPPEVDAPPE